MTCFLFGLSRYYTVPVLTEWLEPCFYLKLFLSFGKADRKALQDLQSHYPKKFQDFMIRLSKKDIMDIHVLRMAIVFDSIVLTDAMQTKTVLINSKLGTILSKCSEATLNRYLAYACCFEKVQFDVPFLDRSGFLTHLMPTFIALGRNIRHLEVTSAIADIPDLFAKNLSNLSCLTVDCPSRRSLLAIIVGLRNLRVLNLKGAKLKNRDWCTLSFHGPRIEELSAGNASSDLSLKTFLWYKGQKLLSLNIDRGSKISDHTTVGLCGACPHLSAVSIFDCSKITELGLFSICGLPGLESLKLSLSDGLTWHSLLRCLSFASLLRSIHFDQLKIERFYENMVPLSCRHLASIVLRECNLTDETLRCILSAQNQGQITTFDISKNPDLSENALVGAVGYLENVLFLNLSNCPTVSNRVVEQVAQFCMSLTSLDVTSCSKISDHGILQVLRYCRDLTTLYMEYVTNCDTSHLIDFIISERLGIAKFRVSNVTSVSHKIFESKLRTYSPSMEILVRPAAPTSTKPNTIENQISSVAVSVDTSSMAEVKDMDSYIDDDRRE